MKTPLFRALARRISIASVSATVLIFALVAMQFPAVAIAQDAPPEAQTSEEVSAPAETVDEEAPTETPEVPETPELPETPEVPPGLTDDTQPPVDTTPEVTEPETPEEETEIPSEPSLMRTMLVAEGDQCVIYSDETTLEGGSPSFEVSEPHHVSWTAVVDALSKWIWGDDPVADPVNDTTQTFSKTFSIEQDSSGGTLVIAADNSYTVELDGVEIGSSSDEDNYQNSKVDTYNVSSAALDAGSHTLTFTVKNWAMAGGTQATNPAGLKYKLTVDDTDCGEPEEETATISAHKIVCPVESELPNWGAGGENIDGNTASEFLAAHPSCYLAPDWQFEWVADASSNTNPGDNVGTAGTPWSLFGPTDEDGMVTASIPAGGKVWVREVMKDGFVPFTGQNTDQNVSAEMYCSTDVLNYDNWDWIDPVEGGETYHCVAFNAPKTATVKMCKTDTEQQSLSGWQLTLSGENVGSVDVEPDGDDHMIEDVGAGDYLVSANGQYVYRPGEAIASTSDAAYSLRHPSDSVYGGPHAPWVRVNDFPSPNTGWLGIQMNNSFTDWGSTFSPSHSYALGTSTDALSDFVFTILDDVYSDNSGHLTVDVNRGYTGVTGEDGCVTFENVPYGSYEAGEILKEGWTNVSGTGTVVVDEPNEIFTIVNTDEELPPENSARIIATKVICDSEEDLPNNSMGKPITAATAQAWVAQSDGACRLAEGWEFEWGNQNAGDAGPTTIGHAANYTTFGTTDVNGVASTYVPLAGITTIQMREVLKDGFIPFTNAGDVSAEFYCANDAAGYDNWEWITNPQAGETYHCVAFNAPVDEPEPSTLKVHIYKHLKDEQGTGQVVNGAPVPDFPMTASWDAANIGAGSGNYVLGNAHGGASFEHAADTSPMSAPADYTTSEVTDGSIVVAADAQCVADKYRLVGYKWGTTYDLAVAATLSTTSPVFTDITTDRYVIVVNEDCDDVLDEEPTDPEGPREETIVVNSNTSAGENQLGWLFNRDTNTDSPFAFLLGNAATGTGSLYVEPIGPNASDKFIGELFLLEQIADIDSISYDFKIATPDATVEEQFYMSVYANFGESSATKFYDCRYDVVPTVGSTGSFTTVTFNPDLVYPVTTRTGAPGVASPHPCPASPSGMDALSTGSSTIRVIALNVGDTSTGDQGVSGYLDRVVVAITGLTTTYDFEPAPTQVIDTDDDSNGGGGGGGGGFSSARARQGEVLGATTAACEALLSTFMKMGNVNDTTEVIELQGFLNEHMNAMLPLTGVFGPMTDAAVHAFQKKYWEDVLKPWFPYPEAGIADMDDSTGYVFKTTQWKVNDIVCPDVAPFPQLP